MLQQITLSVDNPTDLNRYSVGDPGLFKAVDIFNLNFGV
jgi:hypothetical protein